MEHAVVFRALGDGTRLRIMRLMAEADDAICVCELVDALGLPQYLVSKHLSVLRHAGLVEDEKLGSWVGYRPRRSPSPFQEAVYELLRSAVTGPVYERDRVRLRARVALRQDGRCVIGHNDSRVPEWLATAEQEGGLSDEP